ncbi:hypothetical protein [Streptomyces sparsogenes]|uniref:hypothetical protein n=1 Tax=Streptomyces sparsogenes TaxID=67365 RepID=UPI0033D505BD
MRPALRTLRTLPAVVMLAGVALLAAPVARADDDDLAGTRAGEGRPHPGRTEEPEVAPPPGSLPPTPSRPGDEDPGERQEGRHERDQRLPEAGRPPRGSAQPQRPDRPPRPSARTPGETPGETPSAQRSRATGDAYEDDALDAARTEAAPGGRVPRVLPLGTGLALMGLGLGLAFFGLRLRRR